MKRKQVTKAAFVRNETEVVKNSLQKITLNLLPAQTRVETLEGRPHTVIPMVMMTEGVHAGSSGPICYTGDELGKTPEVWNQKPVVVYHPEINGQPISACEPVVVNSRKIGVIMNAQYDTKGKKLKAEAWIEQTRADIIDKRIFEAVTQNKMMELSTGLFVDLEKAPGEWGEEKKAFVGTVRNIRPDHLALLPDKIGACSLRDGAGFLRNQKAPDTNLAATLKKKIQRLLDDDSEISVLQVNSNFVIYENDGQLYRAGFSTSGSVVTLSKDAPVGVELEYRTVAEAAVGNQDQMQKEQTMKKAEKIAAILAVANSGWDQKGLEALNDNQLDFIFKGVEKKESEAKEKETPAQNEQGKTKEGNQTTNQNPAPVGLEAWLNSAPPEVAKTFRGLMANEASEKNELIEKITANKDSGFTKESLKDMTVANLKNILRLAEPAPAFAMPNYSGMAPASGITGNEGKTPEEPLLTPVLNFRKEKAAK